MLRDRAGAKDAPSLALQRSTHRHTGACCLFLRSLARSLSARSPVACLSARSLARSPLARSLSALARSLVLRSLARSLTATHPPTTFYLSAAPTLPCAAPALRAHCYSGDIPMDSPTNCNCHAMLPSRPPWWVCGGDTDARHLPISASSLNRKQSKTPNASLTSLSPSAQQQQKKKRFIRPLSCIFRHRHLLLRRHTSNGDPHPLSDVTFLCSSRVAPCPTDSSRARVHGGSRAAHRHSAPASCL